MMNDKQFEESLKDIFEENIAENGSSGEFDIGKLLESAYKEAEIENDKKEKIDRKRKRVRRIRAAVIFVGIIIASLAVFGPEQGYADIFRFMLDRVGTNGDSVQDNLIGDEAENAINKMIKLDDLDNKMGFHVVLSEYLSDNYLAPEEIQIVQAYDALSSIIIQYERLKPRKCVLYRIMPLENKKGVSATMDIPEDEIEIIKKSDGAEYKYYMDKESMKGRIYWQDNNYFYYFDGDIDKEEAVEIVNTLR